jgi:hypothetical protein
MGMKRERKQPPRLCGAMQRKLKRILRETTRNGHAKNSHMSKEWDEEGKKERDQYNQKRGKFKQIKRGKSDDSVNAVVVQMRTIVMFRPERNSQRKRTRINETSKRLHTERELEYVANLRLQKWSGNMDRMQTGETLHTQKMVRICSKCRPGKHCTHRSKNM